MGVERPLVDLGPEPGALSDRDAAAAGHDGRDQHGLTLGGRRIAHLQAAGAPVEGCLQLHDEGLHQTRTRRREDDRGPRLAGGTGEAPAGEDAVAQRVHAKAGGSVCVQQAPQPAQTRAEGADPAGREHAQGSLGACEGDALQPLAEAGRGWRHDERRLPRASTRAA